MPYPAIGGDRSRPFHFIRALARAGHETHLLPFDATAGAPRVPPELTRHLTSSRAVALPAAVSALQAMTAVAGRRPLQVAYYDSPRMAEALREALARVRPDVVYTHLFRMAPYAIDSMDQHPAAWVLDLTDVISSEIRRSLPFRRGPDRWLYAVEGDRIARYEGEVAPCFDRCWVISEAESRTLASMAPGARIEVVPIGIEEHGTGAGREEVTREPLTRDFLRVGATAEEIAAHVVALLRDPAGAFDLGRRGRDWVRGRFTWDHAVRAFEEAGNARRTQAKA